MAPAATKSLIRKWLVEGMEQKSMFLICVTDTFEHSNYPVYAESNSDLEEKIARFDGPNMQKVKEVYLLEEPLCWTDLQSTEMVRRDQHVTIKPD